jgi:O-antigen/teichoic acid export membrane protein
MIQKFLKDGIIYTIPLLLSRGIGFFLIPLYTRVLNPFDYGVLDLFVMVGSIINLTIALEITQGLAFYHAKSAGAEERSAYASTAFWFTLLVYAFYFLVSILFSQQFSELITNSKSYEFIFELTTLYIFCNGIFLFLQNQLRWELRSTQFAISNIIMTIVTAGTAIILAYCYDMGLTGILWGMIAGVLSGALTSGFKLFGTIRPIFDVQKFKTMLRYSIPLVPSGVCVFLSIYIDRIMINKMMTLDDVGIYGIGVRFATISALLISGFRTAITPLILKHHTEENAPRDIVSLFNIFIGFSLLMYLGASLFSREILMLMATPIYWPAYTIIPILILSTLVANFYIFTPGIFLAEKTHIVFWINFMTAVLNIILNIILIPIMGIMGAALSTLLASFCGFLVYLYFNQKTYYLPINYKKIILPSIIIGAISIAGFALGDITNIIFFIKIILFIVGMLLIHEYKLINLKAVFPNLYQKMEKNS